MFCEKTNADSFCDFLERVHKEFDKVLTFLDNASCHKSAGVKEILEKYNSEIILEKYNSEIILEHILSYTPELNHVEIQWREIKRRLSARVFDTLDDMEQYVRNLFARGEVLPVKMFRYLMG